ncbi:MAG: hypothetical protein KY475_22280 [Planctomycetes bacterium]|nr:hypothetical protein [Planctomycetota bacterium]
MNFAEALRAKDIAKRDELIEVAIAEETWDDLLEDAMEYGGWPDDCHVTDVTVEDDEEELNAYVQLAYVESVPSSCKDYNHEYPGTATFTIMIDRATGECEVEGFDAELTLDDAGAGDYY